MYKNGIEYFERIKKKKKIIIKYYKKKNLKRTIFNCYITIYNKSII